MTKTILLSFLALSSSFAAESVRIPSDQVFDKVLNASRAAGFSGYDVTACVNQKNKLVLGGVSFWTRALQVVVADRSGKLVPTEPMFNDANATSIQYKYQGKISVLSGLGGMVPAEPGIMKYTGVVDGNQKLNCFIRLSNLE